MEGLTSVDYSGGGKDFEYDILGRLISEEITINSTSYETQYGYDDLYRLTSATITNTANQQDYTRTYEYTIIGNINSTSELGTYSYTGDHPHAVTGANSITYTYDANGSLTGDTGDMVELNDYYPYGDSRIEDRATGYENDYMYTGQEKDEETGQYYYGARYYNPKEKTLHISYAAIIMQYYCCKDDKNAAQNSCSNT